MKRSNYTTGAQKRKPIDAGSGGKLENDHNKQGQAPPSQIHQALRTPQSRDDRQAQLGSDNQSHMRKDGVMTPQGGRSH